MNLQATIDILAGGPGSGCRGSNCGRPKALRPSIAKIVAVDFDDTIAKHRPDNREIADPLPNGLKVLEALKKKGYKVYVNSARHDVAWVQSWLDDHGAGFAIATRKKPGAVAYLDDRAVHWTGNQPLGGVLKKIDKMSKLRLEQEGKDPTYRTSKMAAAIFLYGGGPGSGCNPATGKCGRHKGMDTNSSLTGALVRVAKDARSRRVAEGIASIIDKAGGMDSRLYERLPLGEIKQDVAHANSLGAAAAYSNTDNSMIVGDASHEDLSVNEVATHEYGHHLYFDWLATPSEWAMTNNDGIRAPSRGADWDAAKANNDLAAMKAEYETQADIVNRTLRLPPGHTFGVDPDSYLNGNDTLTHVWGYIERMRNLRYPSSRGMANPAEWFAEGFREYMGSATQKARLQRVVPATYHLIDTLVRGGYFTKADN